MSYRRPSSPGLGCARAAAAFVDTPPAKRRAGLRVAGLIVLLALCARSASAATLDDLQTAIDAERYPRAAMLAAAYLRAHPGNRDARFLRARALAGQGETQRAMTAYHRLAEDFPQRVEPANNLAVLYARNGDYASAKQWLDRALATQPAYAVAHRNLGDIYSALADLAYQRALGGHDAAKPPSLTLLDRFYYAGESVAPAPAAQSSPAPPVAHSRSGDAPAGESGAGATAGDRRAIVDAVRAWAIAWSSGDFNRYAGFYADAFEPDGDSSRGRWLAARRATMQRVSDLHIGIDELEIERLSPSRVAVTFRQRYATPRYRDEMTKRLLLVHGASGWQILRESLGGRSS